MLGRRSQLLAARRQALVAQSGTLRERMLWSAAQAHESLNLFQIGAVALRAAGRHPGALVAGGLVLGVLGPRRVLRVMLGGVAAWKLLQRVQRMARLLWRLRSAG
jgi:hypothetical protein